MAVTGLQERKILPLYLDSGIGFHCLRPSRLNNALAIILVVIFFSQFT